MTTSHGADARSSARSVPGALVIAGDQAVHEQRGRFVVVAQLQMMMRWISGVPTILLIRLFVGLRHCDGRSTDAAPAQAWSTPSRRTSTFIAWVAVAERRLEEDGVEVELIGRRAEAGRRPVHDPPQLLMPTPTTTRSGCRRPPRGHAGRRRPSRQLLAAWGRTLQDWMYVRASSWPGVLEHGAQVGHGSLVAAAHVDARARASRTASSPPRGVARPLHRAHVGGSRRITSRTIWVVTVRPPP